MIEYDIHIILVDLILIMSRKRELNSESFVQHGTEQPIDVQDVKAKDRFQNKNYSNHLEIIIFQFGNKKRETKKERRDYTEHSLVDSLLDTIILLVQKKDGLLQHSLLKNNPQLITHIQFKRPHKILWMKKIKKNLLVVIKY